MIALCRRPPCCLAPRREPPDPASTAVPSGVRQHCPRLRRHARDPRRSTLLYPLHPIDVADRFSACAMHARMATDSPIASDRIGLMSPFLGRWPERQALTQLAALLGSIGRDRARARCRSMPISRIVLMSPFLGRVYMSPILGASLGHGSRVHQIRTGAHARWCSALRALLCCNTIREGKEGVSWVHSMLITGSIGIDTF
jgi:hypothetical protein